MPVYNSGITMSTCTCHAGGIVCASVCVCVCVFVCVCVKPINIGFTTSFYINN